MDGRPYGKISADSRLTVRAFVTLYHRVIDGELAAGESHDFPELVYIESGSAPLSVGAQEITLTEGQMLIYAPGTYHAGADHVRAVMNNLGFETDVPLPLSLCNRAISLTSAQSRALLQIITDGAPLFRRVGPGSPCGGMVLCDGTSAADVQRLKNRLELFLLDLTETEAGRPAKPTHTEEYISLCAWIDAHLTERLTLEEIAAAGRISVSKLKLLFREQYGGGVMEFVTARRIEAAKEMIAAGRKNFTQIAQSLGFGTVYYFSRVFRKQTGMPPSEYRRQQYS